MTPGIGLSTRSDIWGKTKVLILLLGVTDARLLLPGHSAVLRGFAESGDIGPLSFASKGKSPGRVLAMLVLAAAAGPPGTQVELLWIGLSILARQTEPSLSFERQKWPNVGHRLSGCEVREK